ncbi:MAG: DUF2490 domain-containing protein [Sphingomonadaceae bacterium]|nr:DUF2490 domain-containing protein [Sphingomonadaceae bacterium]
MLALTPFPALAGVDQDAQAWLTISGSGSIAGPVMGSFELIGRASDDQNRIYETEAIVHIGYKLSKAATVWVGYNRNTLYRGPLPTGHENRAREQLNLNLGKVAGFAIGSRTLLEQRFRNGSGDVGVRLREQIKLTRPFREGGKTALVLWHDSNFSFNSTDWGQQAGYERMRNFAGVGFPIAKSLKAEFGYLNQYDFRKNAPDRMAHAASLTLSFAL